MRKRIETLFLAYLAKSLDQGMHLNLCLDQGSACVDHMVGPLTLFSIGSLQAKYVGKFLCGHSRPGQYPFALHLGRSGYHHNHINCGIATAFEQKWDIEQDQRLIRVLSKEIRALSSNCGVDDSFQRSESFWISKDDFSQRFTVHTIGAGRSWKGCLDLCIELTLRPLHRAHLGIGVKYGNASAFKHRGNC